LIKIKSGDFPFLEKINFFILADRYPHEGSALYAYFFGLWLTRRREGAKEEGGFGFKAHASGRALGDVRLFT
jgi:hypothetical protein